MEGCCGCESSYQMHHIERESGKGHRIGVRLVSQIDDLRSSVAGQAVDAARREMRRTRVTVVGSYCLLLKSAQPVRLLPCIGAPSRLRLRGPLLRRAQRGRPLRRVSSRPRKSISSPTSPTSTPRSQTTSPPRRPPRRGRQPHDSLRIQCYRCPPVTPWRVAPGHYPTAKQAGGCVPKKEKSRFKI